MNENEEFQLTDEAFEPTRQRVDVQVGRFVCHGCAVYRISQVLDFESVIGIEVESGRSTSLRIGDLRPMDQAALASSCPGKDLADIADEDWRIAEQRFAAIRPLVNEVVLGRSAVTRRAKEVGIDTATLYRWLGRYKAYGVVSDRKSVV